MALLTLAGCPRRTTLTPSATSPETMLSTATLDAAVASTRLPGGSAASTAFMYCSSVVVLPVPGGLRRPRVSRCDAVKYC